MVTSQKFYAKSISQTSESTVWNSTNPKNPRKYRKFINLDALKADDSNYATCSNLGGKNGTWNRPSTITLKNFGITLPQNIKITKIIVGYAHSKITYSSKTAYPTIAAPTISLMNVSGSGKGNAVPVNYTKCTKSFNVSATREKVMSGNFGVKIDYPQNTSTNLAGMKLGYVWVQVVYEEIRKKVSGAVKSVTPNSSSNKSSLMNTIDENLDINYSANSVYVGGQFAIDLTVSTSVETSSSLRFRIDLGEGFSFGTKIGGDGDIGETISNIGDSGLFWTVNTANRTAAVSFSLNALRTGTHYITVTDTSNSRVIKKFGIVVLDEYCVVFSDLPSYALENETVTYGIEVFTTNERTIAKTLKIEFPREVLIQNFETEDGVLTDVSDSNGSALNWEALFTEQKAGCELTIELTSSGVYGQVITDVSKEMVLETDEIKVKPITLTKPFFCRTELDEEVINRLGEGITYNASCYMKIEIDDDVNTVANEQDIFEPYEHNYRFGIYQGDFDDEDEVFESTVWSEPVKELGIWTKLELNFVFDKSLPVYLIRTGEYIENQATYVQVYFTEACIIEGSVNNGFEHGGNYPVPIRGLNSLADFSLFDMKSLDNTSPVRLYGLDMDDLILEDIVVEGITVYLDVNCDNSTNLLCNLVLPNGKVGHRSVNIDEDTNGTIAIGGDFDLWGLDFEDFIVEILDDIEIELIAQNSFLHDSLLEIGNARIEFHYLELEEDYIEFWVNGVSSKYYNIFLTDVQGVSGANNDVSYYQVSGSDNTLAYLSSIESKSLELEFYVGSCTIEEATLFLQKFSKLLTNDKDEFSKPALNTIRFAHIPDFEYEFIQEKAIKEKIETGEYSCSVSLVIPDGTAYSVHESLCVGTGANNGIAKVKPIIQLLALSDEITVTEEVTGKSFIIFSTGENDVEVNDIVLIDCASRKLTKTTINEDGSFDTVDISDHVDYDSDWFSIIGEFDFNSGESALVQAVRFRERW